jgi:hypothetical protein
MVLTGRDPHGLDDEVVAVLGVRAQERAQAGHFRAGQMQGEAPGKQQTHVHAGAQPAQSIYDVISQLKNCDMIGMVSTDFLVGGEWDMTVVSTASVLSSESSARTVHHRYPRVQLLYAAPSHMACTMRSYRQQRPHLAAPTTAALSLGSVHSFVCGTEPFSMLHGIQHRVIWHAYQLLSDYPSPGGAHHCGALAGLSGTGRLDHTEALPRKTTDRA